MRVLISFFFVLSANQQHSFHSFYTELLEQNGTNKCCLYRHAVHWGVGGRDGGGGGGRGVGGGGGGTQCQWSF